MNNIKTKQNEQLNLQRLAAQRELYSSAKRIQAIQLILTIPVPIGLSIFGIFFPQVRIIAGVVGLAILILTKVIFDRLIKSRKEKATKIQEMFDCDVLELPLSPFKSIENVTVDDILKYHDAHLKIKSNEEKILNWYAVEVSELPIGIARIICQRSNCRWDKELRNRFLWITGILFGLVLAGLITLGVLKKPEWDELVPILAALLPFFTFCIQAFYENLDSIKRMDSLISHADKNWKAILSGVNVPDLTEMARGLQDEIYNNRSRNALIPDWIYWIRRDQDEKLMNKTVSQLVEQYKNRS